jgi:hypothetical protein
MASASGNKRYMAVLSVGVKATITDEPFPDYVISLRNAKSAVQVVARQQRRMGKK